MDFGLRFWLYTHGFWAELQYDEPGLFGLSILGPGLQIEVEKYNNFLSEV